MIDGMMIHTFCSSLCHIDKGSWWARVLGAVFSLIWTVVSHGAVFSVNYPSHICKLVRVTIFSLRAHITVWLSCVSLVKTYQTNTCGLITISIIIQLNEHKALCQPKAPIKGINQKLKGFVLVQIPNIWRILIHFMNKYLCLTISVHFTSCTDKWFVASCGAH